jgi:hypothetical protein
MKFDGSPVEKIPGSAPWVGRAEQGEEEGMSGIAGSGGGPLLEGGKGLGCSRLSSRHDALSREVGPLVEEEVEAGPDEHLGIHPSPVQGFEGRHEGRG